MEVSKVTTKDWYCYTVCTRNGSLRIYSGASNDVPRRIQQHNQQLAGGAHTTKSWGKDNAQLMLLLGPMQRPMALAIERKLKQTVVRHGAGLTGRLKALVKLLQQQTFASRSVHVTRQQLKRVTIRTSLSEEHIARVVGLHPVELMALADWRFGAI